MITKNNKEYNKYNIKITTNEPSEDALQNFQEKLSELHNSYLDKHDNVAYNKI
jgi:hypothetical protein